MSFPPGKCKPIGFLRFRRLGLSLTLHFMTLQLVANAIIFNSLQFFYLYILLSLNIIIISFLSFMNPCVFFDGCVLQGQLYTVAVDWYSSLPHNLLTYIMHEILMGESEHWFMIVFTGIIWYTSNNLERKKNY